MTDIQRPPAGGAFPAGPPKAAPRVSPGGTPAGEPIDPDAGWQARDGHDSYVLALQVANGKVPHPGRPQPEGTDKCK